MTKAEIEQYLRNEKKNYEEYIKEPKLLLLGASDSGKSTFLKQLKLKHGDGFSDKERQSGKRKVVLNMIYAIIRLVSMIDAFEYSHLKEVF